MRHAFRRLCWIPLASLVAIEFYVRGFDGWGAWASAPLLLVPGLVSVPFLVWGISRIVVERRSGGAGLVTVACSIIAALPLVWLGIRRLFV